MTPNKLKTAAALESVSRVIGKLLRSHWIYLSGFLFCFVLFFPEDKSGGSDIKDEGALA